MRQISLMLFTLVLFSASTLSAKDIDQRNLVGRWTGTGTFYNASQQEKFGAQPIVLQIAPDFSGHGRLGDATLEVVAVRNYQGNIEVRAKLKFPVGVKALHRKDHVVFVITSIDNNLAKAEFHLKTNFQYDFKMREGKVLLSRDELHRKN